MKSVLYIGSGNSAKLIDKLDLSLYTIVCANNAWKLFQNSHFDAWIHSGDFPFENRPKNKIYDIEVSHKDYSKSSANIVKKLNLTTKSPQHLLGYTIFFQGIYWIIDFLKPQKISLLGFDHDYDKKNVEKWLNNNKPNPQNNFNNKPKNESISDWSNKFFKNMKTDFFYGYGSPDPMRLGEKHLIDKFKLLQSNCEKLKINLVNLSPVTSNINIITKEPI